MFGIWEENSNNAVFLGLVFFCLKAVLSYSSLAGVQEEEEEEEERKSESVQGGWGSCRRILL